MSKRVIIDLDDNYAGALTLTAVGGTFGFGIRVSTAAFDLAKCTHIIIGSDGKPEYPSEEAETEEIDENCASCAKFSGDMLECKERRKSENYKWWERRKDNG